MEYVSITVPTNIVTSRISVKDEFALVACGGEDCCAHVYDFGGTNRIARLEGHTTPVTALAFETSHRRVAAGSDGGSIRVLDLETEQTIRTFSSSGHRTTVNTIDYHQYGEFVVSGSRDTHMKVWDIRKKTVIQSYKDAKCSVDVVRCLPDGRQVAAGCEQGVVRVYDLTAGKIRTSLVAHTRGITCVGFHPTTVMCCASSVDGTISVWELENGTKSFQSPGALRSMDAVVFTERSVHGFSDRTLTSYDCAPDLGSPIQPEGSVRISDAPWQGVSDAAYRAFAKELLVTDIKSKPSSMLCAVVPLEPKKDKKTGKRIVHRANDQPPSRLHAGPALTQAATALASPPPRPQYVTPPAPSGDGRQAPPYNITPQKPVMGSTPPTGPNDPSSGYDSDRGARPSATLAELRKQRKKEKLLMRQQEDGVSQPPAQWSSPPTAGDADPRVHTPRGERGAPANNQLRSQPSQPRLSSKPKDDRPPFTLDTAGPGPLSNGEEDLVDDLLKTSQTMCSLMHRRLTHTRVVRGMWPSDVSKALNHLQKVASDGSDAGTCIDIIMQMNHQRMKEKIVLDNLPQLLEIIKTCMMCTRHENAVLACLRLTRSMNTRHKQRIEEGIRAASHASVGVDLALEARIAKARKAHKALDEVVQCAQEYVSRKDAVGEEARLLINDAIPFR